MRVGRQEPGCLGVIPGQHKDGCITPPSQAPRLSRGQMQTAAGPRCGCTDCAEAISFTLMLPGRHCPSPTPPGAEQGRGDPPGPAGGSRHTATAHIGPAARLLSQGDSQFYG